MSFYHSPRIVTNGLVLCLDAGNTKSYTSGSLIWNDLSGRGNVGVLTGSVNPIYTGSFGGNFIFSGSGNSSYINLGSGSGTAFSSPNFSYGAWFYYNGIAQTGTVFSRRNDSPYNQYNIGIANDAAIGGVGTKLCVFSRSDQTGGDVNFSYQLTNAGWNYILVSISTTLQIVYINGAWAFSSTNNYTGNTFLIPGRNCYVGGVNLNGVPANFFTGYISQVFLYNRALSASEVLQNYNAMKGRYNLS